MKILRCGAYESFYDMPLAIDWMLTKRCNYRCSYCFHYGYGKTPPPLAVLYFRPTQSGSK